MNVSDFEREMMFYGNIVQDSDISISDDERVGRFRRYIELLDCIKGSEGLDVARIILRSMQAEDDYGAYQDSQRAFWRFSDDVSTLALCMELPNLILNNREWAGEILCGLANAQNTEYAPAIQLFLKALSEAPVDDRKVITEFILSQELEGGWLSHRPGVLSLSI